MHDPTPSVSSIPVDFATGSHSHAYSRSMVVANKFELIRLLGEGGMGAVWVARNRDLDVRVALKLIRAELSDAIPGIGDRLLQEARAAARIVHPAIIRVFDFGTTERAEPYIAMELLEGESLGAALERRGKVSAIRAVQLLLPVLDALAAAHDHDVVHRDLKPDNIFLARQAGNRLQPKVLDFGIAKLQRPTDLKLTEAGSVMGSPYYMSPEQARGDHDVDKRADLWALSVVLYQMISGKLPFEGNNYNALLWLIGHSDPKPLSALGIVEPELWQLIQRGLSKAREDRWQTATEYGKALADWLLARGITEDVCRESLQATWVERGRHGSRPSGGPILSFFPSLKPVETGARSSSTLPAIAVPVAAATPARDGASEASDPEAPWVDRGDAESGRFGAALGLLTPAAAPVSHTLVQRAPHRRSPLVWIALGATLLPLVFVASALIATRSVPMAHSEPTLAVATRATSAQASATRQPAKASPPSTPATKGSAAPGEPMAGHEGQMPSQKPRQRWRRPPTRKPGKVHRDLKNPFVDGP